MEGSWAGVLRPVQVTGAGRPQLNPTEIECQLVDAVEIQLDSTPNTPMLRSSVVILTTHRIICILDENSKQAWGIPLEAVCKTYLPKKSLKSIFVSPKLRIQLWSCKTSIALGAANATEASINITMTFRGQTPHESFVSKLGEVVEAKAWESDLRNRVASPSSSLREGEAGISGRAPGLDGTIRKLNPAMAGVSGILRKEEQQREETDKNLHEAFQDLNALMGKAKEMVSLAERMRIKLLASPANQQSHLEDEEVGSKQDIQDWLLSVGIASPVTKESAGALYHQQLARQLADFVKLPLQRSGGMLAMVDVYCLFNRARGTELISPEDLLQSCLIWSSIDVPVMLRRFDSGVMVIQSKSQSDDESMRLSEDQLIEQLILEELWVDMKVFRRLELLVKKPEAMKQGISSSDAARSFGIAPALAKEQLLAAESKGILCRDDGADELRFFLNIFQQIDLRKAFA